MAIKLKASKTYCCAVELDYIADRIRHAITHNTCQAVLVRDGKALTNLKAMATIGELAKMGYKYYPCEHADNAGHCKGVSKLKIRQTD